MCVAVLLAIFAAPRAEARSTLSSRAGSTARDRALIAAINSARTLHLLPKLSFDFRLARAARAHSRDMLQRDYFGHGNFGARMSRFHVRGRVFAENLACSTGPLSANAAVADWLASPTHRAIILDTSLRRIGVGSPVGTFGASGTTMMITADFAGG